MRDPTARSGDAVDVRERVAALVRALDLAALSSSWVLDQVGEDGQLAPVDGTVFAARRGRMVAPGARASPQPDPLLASPPMTGYG